MPDAVPCWRRGILLRPAGTITDEKRPMNGKDFDQVVRLIVEQDRRYDRDAYHFVRRALDHTLRVIRDSDKPRQSHHVSGGELLEGIREYALEQYGPMAATLFAEWGVRCSEDFGEIVFNLVDYGVFGKTKNDKREDFRAVYEFRDAFETPFLPRARADSALSDHGQHSSS